MTRFLYDTAVFLYALGGDHAYRQPCREIVERAARGRLRGEASVNLLQEVAHHRFRRTGDREQAVRNARDVANLCGLHAVEPADVERGLALYAEHGRLSARDAVFAALALGRGIDTILSSDRAFDDVRGLERVDPLNTDAVIGLEVAATR